MGNQNDKWAPPQSHGLGRISHQLWPGVRYGLGTMTNDLEVADNLLHKEDYRMLNVLGVVHSMTKGLRRLYTSFGGFGLFNLPVEQLIG